VSAKLQPKARCEAYVVLKRVGESIYALGDVATQREVGHFRQPVHADRCIPLEVGDLTEPMESKFRIEIEGRTGLIRRQAIDGRILVDFQSARLNDAFAQDFKRRGAHLSGDDRGVWLDSERFDYDLL